MIFGRNVSVMLSDKFYLIPSGSIKVFATRGEESIEGASIQGSFVSMELFLKGAFRGLGANYLPRR